MREFFFVMVHTKHDTTQDMIDKLKELKGKTKFQSYQIISNYHNEMNYHKRKGTFQFREDPFKRNTQDNSEIYQEVLLLMKSLQTKIQTKKQ